ncbi:hypothetical protein [Salimicrobium humidisoli]|uniref:Uncharacterized protein n=1 Tax=Salimicrobium humidisoli TaxID=2029857 RepID=A0ABX4HSR5_9BACI|nr:hypothetical protein [Salimicrobium humidisoli]PBB05740.1 hypothetical protein CKW00_06995 [Salimicrobium humidisoli]
MQELPEERTVQIINRLALRRAQSFKETFDELYEDMRRYFKEKYAAQIEQAEAQAEAVSAE